MDLSLRIDCDKADGPAAKLAVDFSAFSGQTQQMTI
jgi:hypothetical protein